MNNLFHTGALDEWGNEYVIKCDHHSYNRDCSYCKDVYDYINYGAGEGYSNCEDMGLALELGNDEEKQEAWEEMKAYFNKWSDYEGEEKSDDKLL